MSEDPILYRLYRELYRAESEEMRNYWLDRITKFTHPSHAIPQYAPEGQGPDYEWIYALGPPVLYGLEYWWT